MSSQNLSYKKSYTNIIDLDALQDYMNDNAWSYIQNNLSQPKKNNFEERVQSHFKNIDLATFDWKTETDNRNWWFRSHSCMFLKWWYSTFHLLTDDNEINQSLSTIKAYFFNWVHQAYDTGDSPLLWHDHGTAFRLLNICEWVTFLHLNQKMDIFTSVEKNRIADIIEKHFDFLAHDKNYSRYTNHGYDQALFMYKVTLLWRNNAMLESYCLLAQTRLREEIDFGYTDQGVHKENSIGYHSKMTGRLATVSDLQLLGEEKISGTVAKIHQNAQHFLNAMTLPDGTLPLIGDTEKKDKAGQPLVSDKHGINVVDFTRSGYAIVHGKTRDGKDIHLVIKTCHFSRYHRQCDDLSLHLYYDGEVILGDAGLLSYNETNPDRIFVRSPLAHNTVYPENYKAVFVPDRLAQLPALSYDSENAVFTAQTSCYGGRLERQIDISNLEAGELTITDQWIEKPSGYSKLIANFFTPNPEKTAVTACQGLIKVKDKFLTISSGVGSDALEPDRSFNQDDQPVVQAANIAESAPACRIFFSARTREKEVMTHQLFLRADPFADLLFDQKLNSMTKKELSTHLWSFAPSQSDTPDDLDYIESVLGCAHPEQLNTDFLYLLIRTRLWNKADKEISDLIDVLIQRADATPSQLINASRQMAFSYALQDPERLYWTHKTLSLIHHHGYGRFTDAYKALARQLFQILDIPLPKKKKSGDFIDYIALVDYIENHIPESFLRINQFLTFAKKETELKRPDSFFDILDAEALDAYLDHVAPYKVFAEINEAIRGLVALQEEELNDLLQACFEAHRQKKSIKREGLYLEIALMLNALNWEHAARRNDIYQNIINLAEQSVDSDASSAFSSGLSYYGLGDYRQAESLLRQFGTFPIKDRFYHQSAAPAFRSHLDPDVLGSLANTRAGKVEWVTRIDNSENSAVMLISCDPGYFMVYARDYLERLHTVKDDAVVHFHIICGSLQDFERTVGQQSDLLDDNTIGVSYEVVSFGNLKTYSSLARYIVATHIMDTYQSPVFISDIDLVIKEHPDRYLHAHPEQIGLFFGTPIHAFFPWQIVKAGAGIYPDNAASRAYLKLISGFMMYSYINGNDGWMLDQMATEYAHRNTEDKNVFYSLKEAGFPITQVQDRPERRKKAKKVVDLKAQPSGLLHYSHNKEAVLNRVDAMAFSDFKVALKSKDEIDLLEKWIKHYGAIFGYENIIIFDNESTDPAVLDIYQEYNGKVGCLFQYGREQGGHNTIHYPDKYPDLYERLARKCKYFALFDTDEFLFHIEDDQARDGVVVRKLLEEEARRVGYEKTIYTFWLNEMPENPEMFKVGNDYIHLYKGVRDGKHFMPAAHIANRQSGHNSCAPTDLVADEVPPHFWLFHTRTATYERRLRVNYNKLKSREALKPGVTLDDLIKAPSKDLLLEGRATRAALSYMNEFIKMKAARADQGKKPPIDLKGGVTLTQDHTLHFTDDRAKQVVEDFITKLEVRHELASYLRHPMTCALNKTAMVELGVYGEVEEFTKKRVTGWVLDTLSEGDPVLQLKLNSKVFDEIRPTQLVSLPFSEDAVQAGFDYEIDKKALKKFAEAQKLSGSLKLRVVVKRVGKSLKGSSQIPINLWTL